MRFLKRTWTFLVEWAEAVNEFRRGTKQYPKGWYY